MKVYRRSADVCGVACDKLKAFHSFKGVSAKVGLFTAVQPTEATDFLATYLQHHQSFIFCIAGNDRLLLRASCAIRVGE